MVLSGIVVISGIWLAMAANHPVRVERLLHNAKIVQEEPTRDIPILVDKSDGPIVAIEDPTLSMVTRPFDIAVAFTAREAPVDLASVKLLVKPLTGMFSLKFYDVTKRLRPYLTEKGFRIPNADIDPGRYAIVLIVRDATGRESRGKIELTVLERSRWAGRGR